MKRKHWWYIGGGLLVVWTVVGNIMLATDTDPTTLSIVGAHVSGATQRARDPGFIELMNELAGAWGAEDACGRRHQLYSYPLEASEQAAQSLARSAERRGYTFELLEEGGDGQWIMTMLMRMHRNGESAYAFWALQAGPTDEAGGILLLCEPV